MAADIAHPKVNIARNGPPGFNLLLNEMKSFKSLMISLMEEVSQLRAENRFLSSNLRTLMQNQDFKFEDIRLELIHLKEALGFECLEQQQEGAATPCDSAVTHDSEVVENEDLVDVGTIMENVLAATQSQSETSSAKSEVVRFGSEEVSVKQEWEEEEIHVVDVPSDQPCTSVATTSSEMLTEQEIDEQRKRSWITEDHMEYMESIKKLRTEHLLTKGGGFFCSVCRTRRMCSRCVFPCDPKRMEKFIKCAGKTMTEKEIEEMMRLRKRKSAICEAHVPGYRKANTKTNQPSPSLPTPYLEY